MKILQSLLAVFFSHFCCLSNTLPRTFSNLTTCTCCLGKISRSLLSSAFRLLLQRINVDYLQRINVFHHDFQSFCVWSLWIFCMPGWNWSVSMIVLACVTSLPHTRLHKFTSQMISFPILIIWSPLKKKVKNLHDTPAHDHAPPYQVWLQKIKWFRRYFLDNIYVKTSEMMNYSHNLYSLHTHAHTHTHTHTHMGTQKECNKGWRRVNRGGK